MVSLLISDFGIDEKSSVDRPFFGAHGIARVPDGCSVAGRAERVRSMAEDSEEIGVGVASVIGVETRVSKSEGEDSGETGRRMKARVSELVVDGGSGCSDGGNDGAECLMPGSVEIRGSSGVASGESEGKLEFKDSEIVVREPRFDGRNDGMIEAIRASSEVGSGGSGRRLEGTILQDKASVLHFNSRIGRADGSKMENNMEATDGRMCYRLNSLIPETEVLHVSEGFMNEFAPGDMVWAKVKSHPWWPGHVFDEAFASSSVRQTRRDGHILVAFFGDSSYGWFDPAELIPFEFHYAEKSSQTNSRTFVKAVEEAVDEARRRSALGLACRCRNPFNFRPANVEGYFMVDMDYYEPGGVYSRKQIEKSRDDFQPIEALSFIQKLALVPRTDEPKDLNWTRNLAAVIAYRRAVFEEFDETYAQAFGVEPVRPSRNAMGVLEFTNRVQPQVPLSGPLVFAESTGHAKNSTKPSLKDLSRNGDRSVFKQRERPNEHRVAAVPNPADDYVLQKRAEAAREGIRKEPKSAVRKSAAVVGFIGGKENVSGLVSRTSAAIRSPASQALVHGAVLATEGGQLADGKLRLNLADKEMDVCQVMTGRTMSIGAVRLPSINAGPPTMLGKSELSGITHGSGDCGQQGQTMVDDQSPRGPSQSDRLIKMGKRLREDATGEMKKNKKKKKSIVETHLDDQHKHPEMVKDREALRKSAGDGMLRLNLTDKKMDFRQDMTGRMMSIGAVRPPGINAGPPTMLGKSELSGITHGSGDCGQQGQTMEDVPSPRVPAQSDGLIKRGKRPSGDATGEMKKKKKKKNSIVETHLDDQHKHPEMVKDREALRKSAGKSIGIVKEHAQMSNALCFQPLVSTPELDIKSMNLEFPELLNDLLGLAIEPSYGIEHNVPAIICQVFLNFRSFVYQKSLVLPPASEPETSQLASNSGVDKLQFEPESENVNLKLLKHSRTDDPTKSGRKRNPSDRQEEMSAKRLKKLNEIKTLAAEKKAKPVSLATKASDVQKGERKETAVVASARLIRPESVRKLDPPARAATPTALVMKFLPQTSLPSITQLKARFARFGPLELDATRVYWTSWTCKVVFKYNSDAKAAYNHAIQNKALFGQMEVNYRLRELELPAPEAPKTSKLQVGDASNGTQPFNSGRNGLVGETRPTVCHQWQPQAPVVQLKSCLKKPSTNLASVAVAVAARSGPMKENPRVKFLLGGDENNSGREPLMVISNDSGSLADRPSSSSSSSMALDFNNKNIKQTIDILPPPPDLPLPDHGLDHLKKPDQSHHHHKVHSSEAERRTNSVDISHQMLGLLIRCNDIVSDVTRLLGYVPYHSL